MVKSIPSVWDETRVLAPSEIGGTGGVCTTKRVTWFLSVMNGLQPRTIKIPLSFLGAGIFNTLILSDNPDNPASARVTSGTSQAKDILTINLETGGGFMTKIHSEIIS